MASDARETTPVTPLRITVFSRTVGFRHDAIPSAQSIIAQLAEENDATLQMTEDPGELIASLTDTDLVVFLMTTGDVLDDAQQADFEAFIRAGGGFVGVHSAADTEYDWPFYGTLIGAWFESHPAIQPARVQVERSEHPAVAFIPRSWLRTDEWYNFRTNPRDQVDVLATLDESSYEGGTMGSDHPIVWARDRGELGEGRALYTALGHTQASWQDPLFIQHIEASLLWAAKR
jgi:type 1 glutamine amidotransferase